VRLSASALVLLLPSIAIAAPNKKECLAASELGQDLRAQGKLLSSRDQFAICANESCPAVIRKDCAKWVSDVQESIPTIVLGAREDGGSDLIDVDVTLDGAPLVTHLDGKSIPVDPGPHKLTFTIAGRPAVEVQVLLTEGDKNHRVQAVFAPIAKPKPVVTAPPEDKPHRSYALPIALGVVGLVGVGTFAYFGTTGARELRDARDTCAPRCDPADVDASKRKLIYADVALGVSVVALAASTILFIHTSSVNVTATPTAAFVSWSATF
jgi:hypothetical protein